MKRKGVILNKGDEFDITFIEGKSKIKFTVKPTELGMLLAEGGIDNEKIKFTLTAKIKKING